MDCRSGLHQIPVSQYCAGRRDSRTRRSRSAKTPWLRSSRAKGVLNPPKKVTTQSACCWLCRRGCVKARRCTVVVCGRCRLSRRSESEFIPFNCSAVPAELIESMLFGHRRGTFTGAMSDQAGLIRSAENGTLFLDEIGDLPLSLQPKLLRFLQEGEIHTLGERAPRKVNVRVIAATHKDLEKLVSENLFREDLYYRIATLTLKVPPLRERREDISALISHFVSHYARKNERPISGITAEAIRILEAYSWPGNIRELAAEIERLVLYEEDDGYIRPENISPRIRPQNIQSEVTGEKLDDLLESYERRVITETLKRHDCNVAKASEALGLGSRQTLYKKLKRLAIDIGDFLQEDTEPGMQYRA